MNAAAKHMFYSSKPRVIHMALNIALAPGLLYFLGVWAWPPILPHFIVFAITGLMALHYTRQRWTRPRLVLDETGLHCGNFYPLENIYKAEGTIRSVKHPFGEADRAQGWQGQGNNHPPRMGQCRRLPDHHAAVKRAFPTRSPENSLKEYREY